jgi:hypothetical protein
MKPKSPLPWSKDELFDKVQDARGEAVFHDCHEDDAAFTIHAANNFQDLWLALEKANRLLNQQISSWSAPPFIKAPTAKTLLDATADFQKLLSGTRPWFPWDGA